jgi:hypothetical protein
MPSGLKFGVYQLIVHGYLEPASFGRDKGNAFYSQLKVVEQFISQADGPVSKVSNSAIDNGYF